MKKSSACALVGVRGLLRAAVLSALAFGSAHAQQAPAAARMVARQAAEALGGLAQVRSVRNISLYGYGQYLNLGENITASPHAPDKLESASDLQRVYDLQHDRFQQKERRYYLFPFLALNAYTYPLLDERLDGDIAYEISSGNAFVPAAPQKPRRIGQYPDSLNPDGIHMRRMWMMNDPVVLVRAMLDPATMLSAPHSEGEYHVIDVTLQQGDTLSVGFSADHLPAFVRWSNPQPDLGEVTFTTWLTGYASIDGLMLPLGYDTRLDWRDSDYSKIYVDHYDVNGQIPDLAAPADVRDTPLPPDHAVSPIKAEKVADHLWRLTPSGTTVIEFQDHLALFEIDAQPAQAKAVIAFARSLVPGKPVTQLIVSHHHFDHVVGLREAVAEGLTVISRRGNRGIFQEMVSHPDPDYPDDLARSPQPLKFIPVDERLSLSDPTMTVWVLWTRDNIHMADSVVAYAPAQKVIMEGDVATAAMITQFWPDNLRDIIDHYHLDVQLDSPVHSVWPQHPGVLTMAQVDELLKGGTQRARALCAAQLAKGTYLTGCPVWSKRY